MEQFHASITPGIRWSPLIGEHITSVSPSAHINSPHSAFGEHRIHRNQQGGGQLGKNNGPSISSLPGERAKSESGFLFSFFFSFSNGCLLFLLSTSWNNFGPIVKRGNLGLNCHMSESRVGKKASVWIENKSPENNFLSSQGSIVLRSTK